MKRKITLVIIFLIIAILAFINKDLLSKPELILEVINSFGIWAPVIFCSMYIIGAIAFFPASFITLLAGALFGLKLGLTYAMIGTVISSCFSFLIARYIAGDLISKNSNQLLEKVQKGVEEDGWRYLAIMRLLPIFPFNLLNYVFGLTPLRLWVFALVTSVSALPITFVYAYIGFLGKEAAEGTGDSIIQIGIGIALLLLISFIPKFFKKK